LSEIVLKICVDSNEASLRKDIVNYLRLAGVEVNIQKLPICDYVISDRCGIERKDVSDFLGSIKDGRLFKQVKDMAENYERPILILEGQMNHALKRSHMKPVSIYGALSSIILDFNFSIISTDDLDSTSILLQRLAYREQVKDQRIIQLRVVDRSLPLHKQQLFLLSGFPQIGVSTAEDLLEHFDTPLKVIEELASAKIKLSSTGKTKKLEGPLKNVRGIGPKIVEYANTLLTSSYNLLCSESEDPTIQK
jgi:ERCC4-type nuclease